MEQGHNSHRLLAVLQAIELLDPLTLEIVHQTVIYVQAVLTQTAFIGPVIPGGGGGREEIAFIFQKIQQLVGPLPGDGGLENVDKFLFAGHGVPP